MHLSGWPGEKAKWGEKKKCCHRPGLVFFVQKGERHKSIERERGVGRGFEHLEHVPENRMMMIQYFPVRGHSLQSHLSPSLPRSLFSFSFLLSSRNPFTPFNSEIYKYFPKHAHVRCISAWLPVLWTTYCQRMNHHHPFFFFYPTSQWIRGHLSLKSFLLLTCHLLSPSSLYPWGPLFIFSSLFFCSIMCSLFLCSSFLYFLRWFHVFFNILSVLAVLQYSLCSPHASPPPPCWGGGRGTISLRAPDRCPLSEPGHHLSLFISLVSPSIILRPFFFFLSSHDHVLFSSDAVLCRWYWQALCLSELCIEIT